ncbi:MAG: GNAT family N-acetyltransferase [Dehalococcoidia bacterium]|nr:GNAT family N-acetyltransferase [Dehalococcoidia bacterium]
MNQMPINGKRLTLQPKSLTDAPLDYAWLIDTELANLNGEEPLEYSYEEYFEQFKETLSDEQFLNICQFFTIFTASERQQIGNCGIYDIDMENQRAVIGISIGDQQFWGKSYGTETCWILLNYAFQKIGLSLLYLKTLSDNIRAQKCFYKCGFRACGSLLETGRIYTIMQLTREEFLRITSPVDFFDHQ